MVFFHLDNASFMRNVAYNFAEARFLNVVYILKELIKNFFPFYINYTIEKFYDKFT